MGTLTVQEHPAELQVSLQPREAVFYQGVLGPLYRALCLPLHLGVQSFWLQGDPGWDLFVELDVVPSIIGNPPECPTAAVILDFTTILFLHGVIPCM